MSSHSDNQTSQSPPKPLVEELALSKVNAAVSGMSKEQLIWTSGYLAGLSQSAGASIVPESKITSSNSVTVLFGSQTGNAKHAAQAYGESVKAKGYQANVISMSDYKPRKIKDESHLVLFVSTHGEGDAPDDAVELHEYLGSKKAPKLAHLKYAVVGLGDTSYEFFCQTGKDFDSRLSALGASPLIDRLDCDVEYEAELSAWTEKLNDILSKSMSVGSSLATDTSMGAALNQAVKYTKQSPYTATLSTSIKITGRDSIKDIRHIEISLEDSGIQYQVGDALGVYFLNSQSVVEMILKATANAGDEKVLIKDAEYTLETALREKLELTLSYPGFVKAYQQASGNADLLSLLSDGKALRTFLEERQIVDIVLQYPENIPAQALVDALRPITPRLYSIASSQNEVEDEVHLTVAHVQYDAHGFTHQGGASGYLSTHLSEGENVKVFVESNDNFRLPASNETPIIMVGPGTGIAPFRAFMQERDAQESNGNNWLFFGNPSFTQDFLYQTEWQAYLKSGLLSKISLAFSRDQKDKIYVQDRMLEHGSELFEWLEAGAHFYVCGDAMRMAKDVELALLAIIEKYGKKSAQEAKQYLVEMRKAKRYQKDVY